MTEDCIPTYSRVARDGMAVIVANAQAVEGVANGSPNPVPPDAARRSGSVAPAG